MLDLPRDEVHVWLSSGSAAESNGIVRSVLGRYLDEAPEALRFTTAPGGKPSLVGDAVVRFNLSHSGGVVAVAVAREREVGVDVEWRRAVHSEAGVARRIMNDAEHARYLALPEGERAGFLLWVWARKEALVKAAGVGIRASLRGLSCEPMPTDRFAVADLDVPGCAAAVAAEGHDWRPVVQKGPAAG